MDASINADQVVLDATINADFRLRGGIGSDSAVSATADQDLLTINSNGANGTFTVGPDGINGNVTYDSGANIDFSEFEDVDADNVSIDTINLSLSSGNAVDDTGLWNIPAVKDEGRLGVGLAQKHGLGVAAQHFVQVPRPNDGRAGGIGVGRFVAENECRHVSGSECLEKSRAL